MITGVSAIVIMVCTQDVEGFIVWFYSPFITWKGLENDVWCHKSFWGPQGEGDTYSL